MIILKTQTKEKTQLLICTGNCLFDHHNYTLRERLFSRYNGTTIILGFRFYVRVNYNLF